MRAFAVVQPLGLAWQRTRRILFEPFQLSQWLRCLPVWRGWRPVLQTVVREPPKGVALYVLMKMVVNTLVGIVALVAILRTRCLAAVPYIGSVLLLPLSLLPFIHPLVFLEQLGPDWEVLSPRHPARD
ncbi:MAG: hypothetical protein ACK587_03440 [Cyanobacteriota bacterium]